MIKKFRFALMLFSVIIFTQDAFAQFKGARNIKRYNSVYKKKRKRLVRENTYTAVGLSINALNYYGDLAPFPSKASTDIDLTNPGFGITFVHRYGPRYTFVAELLMGQLEGSDAASADGTSSEGKYRKQRNASFRNPIQEITALAVFDLFQNKTDYRNRVNWTPYIFTGFTVFNHNPQAQAPVTFLDGTSNPRAGEWIDLQPLGTEGQYASLLPTDANYGIKPYSLTQVAIPFGIGARIRIGEYFDIWADMSMRFTFTDYLDDVSRNYVDLNRFKDPLTQALSYRSNEIPNVGLSTRTENVLVNGQMKSLSLVNGYGSEYATNIRGNAKQNDIYTVASIKLTYIITRLGKAKHR
ncbi:MAG: hypothetical protein HOP30_08840 [Cyclobacteriaceae bacterium]|nr:hypothetical protein [Cyclobacteriaceae bacterium]